MGVRITDGEDDLAWLPKVTSQFTDLMTPWKKWWAWKPVTTISGERVWFTWCYRRTIDHMVDLNSLVGIELYEYGTIFDVITHPNK